MTNDAELQPMVADELARLADLLEALPETQWDIPSLCQGWRVREVVAHMTMAARYSNEEFMEELRAHDFDFTRLSNHIASRDADLPTAALVDNLRSEAMQQWTPPGGGHRGALNHAVIHGLDIAVPLGVRRHVVEGTMRFILDDLTAGGVHARFGTDLAGRHLEATDLDWSYGDGIPLRGAAEDLALAICGRALPGNQLHGTPLTKT
jgi:uncharacterized protein (TIGR03083 family)